MFKLLRLAIYGIVGYALYSLVTDVVNSTQAEGAGNGGGGQRRGGGNRGRGQGGGQPVRMTGAKRGGGAGKPEETADTDGGTTRHRVGRGVV
jgi:hypothetical protein